MRWFYSSGYDYGRKIPGLPARIHGFIRKKPSLICHHLKEALTQPAFEAPEPLPDGLLERVHTQDVVQNLSSPRAVAAAVELWPLAWLPTALVKHMVVTPQVKAAGGTLCAMRAALGGQWAANLSGGFHHARPGLSHGFCLVNDVALAIEALRIEGHNPKVLVLDLDLHQGDGNSAAFAADSRVFTASLHEAAAFPHPRVPGDLDVELPSGLGDAAYLSALDQALDTIAARFTPDILVYVAGSDPYQGDPLGDLGLSRQAMVARDIKVARFALDHGSALVALPAGGYSAASAQITAAGFAAIAKLAPNAA